jgi:capsular polysaccharide biosynthesis protein
MLGADLQREGGGLVWALRHYAWLVVVCVLACAGAALAIGATTPTYQASALVVSSGTTNVPAAALPHLAESIFADGAVEAAVADDDAVAGRTSGLIPGKLNVIAPEDSIVLTVQARDDQPDDAARLADTAAAAFVGQLNKPGPGVGVFEVQNPAVVPTEPMQVMSPTLRATLGALAGLALGVGLAALIVVLRRPVLTPKGVQNAAGVPLLGTVELPVEPKEGYTGPLGVRGLATVTRWVATVPGGRLLLISPSSAVALRQRLYVMVGVALSTVRRLRFRAPQELVGAIEQHREHLRTVPLAESDAPDAGEQTLVLVDGGSPIDILDPAVTTVSVVAVAPRGISRNRLAELAADYLDAGLVGVVLVDARTGLRSRTRRAAASAPATSRSASPNRIGAPEPERA